MASVGIAAARPLPPQRATASWLTRRILLGVAILVGLVVLWEGLKFLGGTPWRLPGASVRDPIIHRPPFLWPFVNDYNLPHIWNIAIAFTRPFERGTDVTLAGYLFDAAMYTWREAGIGFLVGTALGVGLASLFVHLRLLERAFVPYVIASQTIPIIALTPIVVSWTSRLEFGGSGTNRIIAVAIVATYLTFFPVTIAMLRGLRSFDPRAMELMRSYAASRPQIYWKLRLPASLPYLFTSLKIAATASIVGAIIGEDTGGVQAGLGRVIITFAQYYITGPEKLWATIIASALLGIAFFIVIHLVELLTLRGRAAAPA